MWIGTPGNFVALPQLQPDISVDEDRGTVIHTSVAGGKTAQHMFTDTKRVYSVPWRWLTSADLTDLLAFKQGQYGPGPFTLLTELDTNLFTSNQSSGTDTLGTTTGFSSTHGTLSSAAGGYKGSRQLNWQLPVSPPASNPSVNFRWKSSTIGTPVVPNEKYAFSVFVKTSIDIDIRLKFSFRTAANVVTGEVAWEPVPVSSEWTRLDVAGTAPDDSAFVQCLIIAMDPAGSELISIDHAQLEFGNAATAWTPGLGIPYVTIEELPRGYPLKGYHTPGQVKFVEVGF